MIPTQEIVLEAGLTTTGTARSIDMLLDLLSQANIPDIWEERYE